MGHVAWNVASVLFMRAFSRQRSRAGGETAAAMKKSLHEVLNARPRDRVITAPGVYDMVSLRMAARYALDALYMTGYGTMASHLGLPDAGLASYSDMVNRVEAHGAQAGCAVDRRRRHRLRRTPNVRHTVMGYERAGAAAIQLEDQEFPKKCGHTQGRRVIAAEDMVQKIAVAVEARAEPRFPDRRPHRRAVLAWALPRRIRRASTLRGSWGGRAVRRIA